MKRTAASLALAIAVTFVGRQSRADGSEKKIKESEVPRGVINAVARKYPGAQLKGFETEDAKGKMIYEIAIVSGQEKLDVELTPEGKIVAEEQKITAPKLPAAVKAGLAASKYKGWKINGAEKVIKDEKIDEPFFEVVVSSKDRKTEVVFDKDGKITAEEEKSPRAKD